jgi:acetyl-CoA carboxylase biotin carboxyl carrier protein
MDTEKLKEFIELAREYNVSSLKYESKDEKYSVSLGGVDQRNFLANPGIQAPMATSQAQQASASEQSDTSHLKKVTSPFVGTFYSSPSPDSPIYVKAGDSISSGKVMCIVEAMKIMNEIESDISGKVVEICVENEDYVEFGQTLFLIDPK